MSFIKDMVYWVGLVITFSVIENGLVDNLKPKTVEVLLLVLVGLIAINIYYFLKNETKILDRIVEK